jgi:Tol biopolymer transport system component
LPPQVAPHRILFTSFAHSQSRLYVANSDGSDEHSLLDSSSLDYNPAWSPDGQWIVFTSDRDRSSDLYRVKPDGTGLERLTEHPAFDDQAAFSPDSKRLVFVSTRAEGRANLWLLNLKSLATKRLTSGPGGDFRPAWSPDGKWIAFSSDRGSTLTMRKDGFEQLQIADIYIVHPNGSGLKRLTQHGNFCGSPKWKSDSSAVVAYCMSAEETWTYRRSMVPPDGKNQIVEIDIETSARKDLPAGAGVKISPALLPSGEVAYVRKDDQAPGVYYGAGKAGPKGNLRTACWSPDGTRVVYDKVAVLPFPNWQKVWTRNPNYEFFQTGYMPAFDGTGQRVVLTGGRLMRPGQNNELLIMDQHGQQAKTIFHDQERRSAFNAQWSPSGDQLVFCLGAFFGLRSQGAQIASIKPDGSDFRLLTSGVNNNGFPSFAPDGKRIVYRTIGAEGQGLRILDLETKQVTVLTTEYDNLPLWSPRGDLIAFVREVDGDFEIYTIHPDGGNLRRLTNSPGNDAHGGWSPDGEWLLFSSARMGFKDEVIYSDSPQPCGEFFVMRYDGSQVEQLTDNNYEEGFPAWQPEPKHRAR